MTLKVKTIGHRVIVKPDPIETKTASGIIVQVDKKREETAAQRGTVMQVGTMAWKNTLYGYGIDGWEPWVKAGDRVFFARYAGKMFRDGEELFVVLNDEDIQCLIEEETVEPDNSEDE